MIIGVLFALSMQALVQGFVIVFNYDATKYFGFGIGMFIVTIGFFLWRSKNWRNPPKVDKAKEGRIPPST